MVFCLSFWPFPVHLSLIQLALCKLPWVFHRAWSLPRSSSSFILLTWVSSSSGVLLHKHVDDTQMTGLVHSRLQRLWSWFRDYSSIVDLRDLAEIKSSLLEPQQNSLHLAWQSDPTLKDRCHEPISAILFFGISLPSGSDSDIWTIWIQYRCKMSVHMSSIWNADQLFIWYCVIYVA